MSERVKAHPLAYAPSAHMHGDWPRLKPQPDIRSRPQQVTETQLPELSLSPRPSINKEPESGAGAEMHPRCSKLGCRHLNH